MRNNNKGLSLIELVVSIGIMSIVMVIATAMLINASKYFERQAALIEIQNEAQIITNYLTETIMEASDVNLTINNDVTGAGVFEFYHKDSATGNADGKGSQRVLHYYHNGLPDTDVNQQHILYMVSFDTGNAAPDISSSYGNDGARPYMISDEITEFKIFFDYGEETDPENVVDLTGGGTHEPSIDPDSSKTYVVKNPLRIRIEFTIEHGTVSSTFEVIADCRNALDDITYTKGGTTTTFKAYNR